MRFKKLYFRIATGLSPMTTRALKMKKSRRFQYLGRAEGMIEADKNILSWLASTPSASSIPRLKCRSASRGWPNIPVSMKRPIGITRYASRDVVSRIDAATELSGDPDFGLHVGERISPASYPVLGYTLMSCRNLSHAIAQVTRYESIIHNLGHFSLDLTDDAMTLTWRSTLSDSTASRHVTESVMAGVRVFAERLVTRNPSPRFDLYPQFTRQDRRTPAAAGRARCL